METKICTNLRSQGRRKVLEHSGYLQDKRVSLKGDTLKGWIMELVDDTAFGDRVMTEEGPYGEDPGEEEDVVRHGIEFRLGALKKSSIRPWL